MRVSLQWLKGFFPDGALDDAPPEELARRLTTLGLAVEDLRPAAPGFAGVVLGKVLESGPHPNADKLSLCVVTTGDGDERRVVCGAPNVEEGAIYGLATVGARLPGEREIGRATIRGVQSEGMLCSAPELGLDALGSAEGIWKVPGVREADLGRDLREVLGLDDTILDVEVTSNRGDWLSHLGVAREARWLAGVPPSPPAGPPVEEGPPIDGRVEVAVEDAEGCPRYLARLVEGVRIGPSPGWLQIRLLALGMRPVNNVVDATNYVMLERGQPLHPFDFERVRGGRIVVRRAGDGEEFTTLDGKRRTLDAGMTMICDAEAPVAVGGVMGGLESEVNDATTAVLLESAWFDPDRISRTARRLGLASEASTRFARGVDPEGVAAALDRAAGLIAELAGGAVARGVAADQPGALPERPPVRLRIARLAALTGRGIATDEARRALESLGFEPEEPEAGVLEATPPSWRFDVSREVDLIEEVARLTGYDAIPTVPPPAPPVAPPRGAAERALERIGEAARAAGFTEARTVSFVGEDALGPATPIDKLVEIRNPISKAERFLRPFVASTLGRAVAHNLARGAGRAKLYEIGHAFEAVDGEPGVVEVRRLALAAAGARWPLHWSRPDPPAYDFFDLKGDLEDVLVRAAGGSFGFARSERGWLHPGRQAGVVDAEGRVVGFCGEVHPAVAGAWGVEGRLLVAEVDLAAFGPGPEGVGYEEFPREPASERDLALVVPVETPAAAVVAAIRGAELENLAGIEPFDRYRGPQVPEGRVSLGVRLTFQAERTLKDEEIDAEVDRLVEALERDHGWRLR